MAILTHKTKRLVKAVAHRAANAQSAPNVTLSVTLSVMARAVNAVNVLNVGRVVMLKLLA
jgi:hypothetical protein